MSLRWEDCVPGQTQSRLDKGRISTAHIMRWSAAVENFHRIHYDAPFAIQHDKLPGIVVNGSWKQHVLVQLVKDMLGIDGWLWRLSFRYKAMDLAGDSVCGLAQVIEKHEINKLGFLVLKLGLENQRSEVTTAGYAVGVLPVPGGPAVPYPFEPDPSHDVVKLPPIE